MKNNQKLFLALVLWMTTLAAYAQGTAFTYQGRLNDGASPANGSYDFRFRVALDPFANVYAAPALLTNSVPVANGLFTVTLDFGDGVFTGAGRWLEIAVRTNGTGAYITLSPLQPLTAAPHAIIANSASNLLGSLPANQLSGALPSAQLAGTYSSAVTLNNPANSFTGDGSGLTAVNAFALGGVSASGFWKLSGNAVAPGQFIGSTNFQAVELRANALPGWRVEPDPRPGGIAANLIGGSTNNAIEGRDSGGNVIVGGGWIVQPNVVHSNSSGVFIGAGSGNHIGPNVNDAVIGGGNANSNAGFHAVISGGERNAVEVDADHATIGGGGFNTILGSATFPGYGVIAGGQSNSLGTNSSWATIGGGHRNTNQASSSTICGGEQNTINASVSIIGGGFVNTIHAGAATIGGGQQNTIQTSATFSTIGGGEQNTIQTNASSSTIGGGDGNTIQANAGNATIGGGSQNTIQPFAELSTIGGGSQNTVRANAIFSTIGGGRDNTIQTNADFATIGGGYLNTVQANAGYSTIGGGQQNRILPAAFCATIPGGLLNSATNFAFAAGYRAKANHIGAFVWADSTEADFASTATNQFLIRAAGGVGIGTRSPQAGLHVLGAGVQLRLEDTTFNNYWNIHTEALGSPAASGNLVFIPKVGVFGYIRRSDGNYFSGSDARLKKDIQGLGGVLDRVLRLRPVSYRFKTAPASAPPAIGLIAQEVEPLFPEVVGEHNGMKALAYSELVPVTVGAIQELNQKLNDELKRRDAENAELKRSVDELKTLVNALAGKLNGSGQ